MTLFAKRMSDIHIPVAIVGALMAVGDVMGRKHSPTEPREWVFTFKQVDPFATALTNPIMTAVAISSTASALESARTGNVEIATWRTVAAITWGAAEVVTLVWNEPLNSQLRRIDPAIERDEVMKTLQRRWNAISTVRSVLLCVGLVSAFAGRRA